LVESSFFKKINLNLNLINNKIKYYLHLLSFLNLKKPKSQSVLVFLFHQLTPKSSGHVGHCDSESFPKINKNKAKAKVFTKMVASCS
jgi:hypothetical protein